MYLVHKTPLKKTKIQPLPFTDIARALFLKTRRRIRHNLLSYTLFPHEISVWSIHRALNRVCHTISTRKGGSKAKKNDCMPFSLPGRRDHPGGTWWIFAIRSPPILLCGYTSSSSSPRAYYPTGKFPMARFPRVIPRFFVRQQAPTCAFLRSPPPPPPIFSTPGINRFLEEGSFGKFVSGNRVDRGDFWRSTSGGGGAAVVYLTANREDHYRRSIDTYARVRLGGYSINPILVVT